MLVKKLPLHSFIVMKIGIFFGGSSREREISFAGGRTVFDNLNKSLFEALPIFVDSLRNFILLDWTYLYKGSIRDFYPPVDVLPDSPHGFQIYAESLGPQENIDWESIISRVGKRIYPHEFATYFDFAFLCLHGSFGEDGQIQGMLESFGIPYSGSGILPSAIGINKLLQKRLVQGASFHVPPFLHISRREWWQQRRQASEFFMEVKRYIGSRFVVKPANQGSSVGVSVVKEEDDVNIFRRAVDKAFFIHEIERAFWESISAEARIAHLRRLSDIREGIGFPVRTEHGNLIYHPEALLSYIYEYFKSKNNEVLLLEALEGEEDVLIETFIEGKEFSCIVIRNSDGRPVALPPTEIVKGTDMYDYRSKYLAGLARKVTPIRLPDDQINAIRRECEKLFDFLGFHVYARIDGFIRPDEGVIYLNDPNTTSGMLPSSFFFHQAAEIGLNPSQFLTYIIYTSLQERMRQPVRSVKTESLLCELDARMGRYKQQQLKKKKIAVILGGYSSERHISVESGRNVYEKLSASEKYEPIPIFLTGNSEKYDLYRLPIHLLLKDHADDIRDKIIHRAYHHPVIEKIKLQCRQITTRFASDDVIFEPQILTLEQLAAIADGVFIALHGRPGEDGSLQQQLERVGLPYNGSGVASSQITINKYETLQILKQHGFQVARQHLFFKNDYLRNPYAFANDIMKQFSFPFVAKPVDDGCSSAVKKIKNPDELWAYLRLIFRDEASINLSDAQMLKLKPNEEFPAKEVVLIEEFITAGGAKHFLEITCGMLTHWDDSGQIIYEVFEPSETLVADEVLSLEEKFLAGEGQNITPARLGTTADEYRFISSQIKKDLERAARILNIQGYCRIDAFVRVWDDMKADTIIIEVNSLPGMTPATCIFHQAALQGYKPYDFIDRILEFAFKRQHLAVH